MRPPANGTLSHLTGELLAQTADIRLLHAPYKGAAPLRMAGLALPATQTVVDMASLLCRQNFKAGNDLIEPLGLDQETPAGLLQSVA